jgi:hypothetical protein
MKIMKPKPIKSDDLNFFGGHVSQAAERETDFFEVLHGRKPQYPVHGMEGFAFQPECAFQRTRTGQWELLIRLGDSVYSVLRVATGDAAFEKLPITVIGPSESQIASSERAEARKGAVEDAQQRQNEQRRSRARERLQIGLRMLGKA